MICPKCKENTLEATFVRSHEYDYQGREKSRELYIRVACHNWSAGCNYYEIPSELSGLDSIETFILKMFEPQIQAVVDKDYKR